MWDITIDNELSKLIPEDSILRDEPMYKHTTFKTGGSADRFISVSDKEQLMGILDLLKSYGALYSAGGGDDEGRAAYYVIGNGSNLLVSDKGYDGLIIEIGSGMSECIAKGNAITAKAGTLLGKLAKTALDNSLTGLEFASGIPGSVGGAMVMNAGAYGGQMEDVVRSVTVYDIADSRVISLDNAQMDFAYRHSIIRDKGYIVLDAEFVLKEGDKQQIEDKMRELNTARKQKQPLEYPSAGSTFKRPAGFYAGGLIEECGLKGYSVGGASVSDKHAGFMINKCNATAYDIYRLIGEVREKVYADTGVRLEPEVIFMGEF